MAENHIMFIGERETFIVRVLLKKLQDAGMNCSFVPWHVNDINDAWGESTGLVIIYMDEDKVPGDQVVHFLMDKSMDETFQIILIGEKADISAVSEQIQKEMLYKTFTRPIDNEAFVQDVGELMQKMDEGEFRKRILVVDDDAAYLNLVREWLKGVYKVSLVNSGLQAIKWLGRNKVDLILLDHEMPVTSGPQVLEMLRSDEETKDIPVFFLTGKSDKESVMAVVALKPEGYLLKNIEKGELLAKLREYFMSTR